MTLIRHKRTIVPAFTCAMLALAQPGYGQTPTNKTVNAGTVNDLTPGTRVRVILRDSLRQGPLMPKSQALQGQLVRVTADSLYLQVPGAVPFGLARSEVGVAVSRGASRTRSAIRYGIAMGTLAALMANAGSLVYRREEFERNVVRAAAIFGGGGIVLGALSPYESWRRVKD